VTARRRAPDDAATEARSDERIVPVEAAEVEMTLVEHLQELRQRLFVCAAAVFAGTAVGFVFREAILELLLRPLPIEANALISHDGTRRIAVTGIGEGFSVLLKLSIAAGIALATPVWVHQLWSFTLPALRAREKKYAVPVTSVGIGLFIAGLGVGFVTLRYPINWLLSFDDGHFVQVITADNYFTFVAYFLLAFGVTFELPLVLTFMAVVGVVSSRSLKAHRAHILVGLWIASCFVTPGADPYSPLIVGVAFTVLYFVSEILIRLIGK
jgi:sec-independent protein translocase protein TatC